MIIQNKPIPACALLETSVSIASASLLFPPAVIVTQVIVIVTWGYMKGYDDHDDMRICI